MTLSHTHLPLLITSLSSAQHDRGAISLYFTSKDLSANGGIQFDEKMGVFNPEQMLEFQKDTFISCVYVRDLMQRGRLHGAGRRKPVAASFRTLAQEDNPVEAATKLCWGLLYMDESAINQRRVSGNVVHRTSLTSRRDVFNYLIRFTFNYEMMELGFGSVLDTGVVERNQSLGSNQQF